VGQRCGFLARPHGGHGEPHQRRYLRFAAGAGQLVLVGGAHDHGSLVDDHDRAESLGVQQARRLGRCCALRNGLW